MSVHDNANTQIFISYAWGENLNNKEWIREQIINCLELEYNLFWDRDSIAFGDSIDLAIQRALATRPLKIFCLCDRDYVSSSKKIGSGLHQELHMLSAISSDFDVKIIPIILDRSCLRELPTPLIGKAYLDLSEFRARNLFLGDAMQLLASNATQSEILSWIDLTIRKDDLGKLAREYFHRQPARFIGNARTHKVSINYTQPLFAPQWMWNSTEWNNMLNDENDTYCPVEGRWHWDYFSPGRSMQALGTAIIAHFFPHDVEKETQWAIEEAGKILAVRFISFNRQEEPFILDIEDIIISLMHNDNGCHVLDYLLKQSR